MIRSIYLKTLYQKRWMTFWWVIGVVAMVSFTLLFFPTLKNSNLAETFAQLPAQFAKLAGDSLSFNSIQGYVGEQLFGLRLPMMTIILAITLFTGLTATEEDRGTLASQLTLPISRTRLLIEKFLAATTILAIIHIAIGIGIILTLIGIHESLSILRLVQTLLGCLLLSLSIGSFVFFIGAATGLRSLAIGVSSYIVFQSYLLSSLVSSIDELKTIEQISLFHYFPSLQVMRHGPNGSDTLVFVGVILTFLALACITFKRRDIRN